MRTVSLAGSCALVLVLSLHTGCGGEAASAGANGADTDAVGTDMVNTDIADTDAVGTDMADASTADSDAAGTESDTDTADSDVAETDTADTDGSGTDTAATDTGVDPGPVRCADDGTLRFAMSGEGLADRDGRMVRVVVVEPALPATDGSLTPRRDPVSAAVTIRDGAFAFACPAALDETYGYPYWAAYLDVDGDARCTSADVGVLMQYFGWMEDLDVTITAGEWQPTSALPAPVGGVHGAFCADAFPAQ